MLQKPEAYTDREIARKVGMEVHMHFPAIWKALEAMKMQDGLGAFPKGIASPRATIRQLDGVRQEF